MKPMNSPRTPRHIILSGGGTAGHLFPGLAVAEQIAQLAPEVTITFVGSGKPPERRAVRAAGFGYVAIASHPIPKTAREAVRFVGMNWSGFRAAQALLGERPAAVVVGLGGYASVPMARAAVGAHVPLMLLEQNLIPGRATRWLARSAQRICTSFEETRHHLRAVCPVRCVGNPLRKRLGRLPVSSDRAPFVDRPRRLLILGGSQGSATMNDLAPKALHHLRARLPGWEIVHQSGEADRLATERLYAKLSLPARVLPFLDDLQQRMHTSQLAVSRAGGTTLAELAAAGLPAVLVPYPQASDDHQRINARHFETAGAAVLFDTRDEPSSPHALAERLVPLLDNDLRRKAMSAAMQSLGRVQAAWHVASMLLELAALRPAPCRAASMASRRTVPRAASAL